MKAKPVKIIACSRRVAWIEFEDGRYEIVLDGRRQASLVKVSHRPVAPEDPSRV